MKSQIQMSEHSSTRAGRKIIRWLCSPHRRKHTTSLITRNLSPHHPILNLVLFILILYSVMHHYPLCRHHQKVSLCLAQLPLIIYCPLWAHPYSHNNNKHQRLPKPQWLTRRRRHYPLRSKHWSTQAGARAPCPPRQPQQQHHTRRQRSPQHMHMDMDMDTGLPSPG